MRIVITVFLMIFLDIYPVNFSLVQLPTIPWAQEIETTPFGCIHHYVLACYHKNAPLSFSHRTCGVQQWNDLTYAPIGYHSVSDTLTFRVFQTEKRTGPSHETVHTVARPDMLLYYAYVDSMRRHEHPIYYRKIAAVIKQARSGAAFELKKSCMDRTYIINHRHHALLNQLGLMTVDRKTRRELCIGL